MVKGGKNLPGLTLSLPGMTLGEVDRSCTTDWSILDALKISRLLPRSIRRRPNGNRLPVICRREGRPFFPRHAVLLHLLSDVLLRRTLIFDALSLRNLVCISVKDVQDNSGHHRSHFCRRRCSPYRLGILIVTLEVRQLCSKHPAVAFAVAHGTCPAGACSDTFDPFLYPWCSC
jgi:hypothetical protein